MSYKKAQKLFEKGQSIRSISRDLGLPYSTLHGKLKTVKTKTEFKKNPSIFVIGDTQVKPDIDLDYIHHIGSYIQRKKPDVVVMIGDWYDMPSLSSYDKGKRKAEGKRFINDINVGNKALEILDSYLDYNPRKILTLGNHEARIDRYVEDNPEFEGLIGTDHLGFQKHGWEVYPFLKPVEVCGIYFVHYLMSPNNGRAAGGRVAARLDKFGDSFVMGHQQTMEVHCRELPLSGKKQIGAVVGSCYNHDESYKSYQGNHHFRGCLMLHDCRDGFAVHTAVELDYMKRLYETK